MEVTNEVKEALLEIFVQAGYQGYTRGDFYIDGKKIASPTAALTRLGVPAILDTDRTGRIYGKYAHDTAGVRSVLIQLLKSVDYSGGSFDNPEDTEEIISDGTSDYIESIKGNIALFKTARASGVYDPYCHRSSGISIIPFNIQKRMIVDPRQVDIEAILRIKGVKREEIPEMETIPYVWPEFNPYTTELVFEKYNENFGIPVKCLNTAIPPKWMTEAKDVKAGLDGFIKKLILHLFPDDTDRELVLDWCHYAIFKRNGTVLCLAGERGTGKSTFIEILGELVGTRYTEIVGQAILEEKFNPQFNNKRLIIFEEVALEDAIAINKVKAWCNNKISIEEKGRDAFSADNFSSMVFLVNRLEELKVSAQERRFSIPIVASENLLTVCTEAEIDDFKTRLAEGDVEILKEIAAFGRFLMERKPRVSEHVPIRGTNFNRVADLSLAEWQSAIRDYIQAHGVAGETIPIHAMLPPPKSADDIKPPRKKSTIENFLRDYRHLGKYKIGDLVDLDEAEFAKFNNMQKRPVPTGGRTRRMYGIRPREEFLNNCGAKKQKPEDLL